MAPAGDPTLDPDRIRATGFSSAFRGYDQNEVRRYLERLAEALRARSGPPHPGAPAAPATGDRARAAGRPGERVGAEAQAGGPPATDGATVEAGSVVAAARAEAEALLGGARAEAERLVGGAQAEAEAVVAAARAEAEALVGAARAEAEALVGAARAEAERLVAAARAGAPEPVPAAEVAPEPLPGGARADGGPALGGARADAGGSPHDRRPTPAAPDAPLPRPLPPAEAAALDELFAKVRRSRSQAVADARRVLAAGEPVPRTGSGDAGADRGDAEVRAGLERDALRRFKRAMADDQGELLDAISGAGQLSLDHLPSHEDRRRRYRQVGVAVLGAAVRGGSAPPGADVDAAVVSQVATSLGDRVADALHDGISRALAEAATGAGAEVVVEQIRAHYRQVRLGRLARLVRSALDEVHDAGSVGTPPTGNTGAGTPVHRDQEAPPP